jgi:putative phage-type endonuclease
MATISGFCNPSHNAASHDRCRKSDCPCDHHTAVADVALTPGSPEWIRLMTASKVAAVLGVSPWQSPFSLWQEMKGNIQRPESNESQTRGHYLEPAILAWWRDQHDVAENTLTWNSQPSYNLDDWAAATPDALAFVSEADGWALVEAKSAAYDDEWGDPGTDAIPAYYLTQVFWQMHVSGVHRCYVPIITSRLRFVEYVVDYDPAIGADLERRCREFYDSLAADVPPPLDDTVATFESMRRLHPEIDAKTTVHLAPDVAAELVESIAATEQAAARERLARSTVLDAMGRANWADCNGVRIARRQPNKTGVSFVPVAKTTDFLNTESEGAA